MKTLKIKYKGHYIEGITSGTSLYEISKRVKEDFKYDILGAKFKNQIVDLSKEITENAGLLNCISWED